MISLWIRLDSLSFYLTIKCLAISTSTLTFFDLRPYIQFSTTVTNVRRLEDGNWEARLHKKGAIEDEVGVFHAVFACTGRHSVPRTPDFQDLNRFKGIFLHSHWYRTPAAFAGKKVVLIGLGNTGRFDSLFNAEPHS